MLRQSEGSETRLLTENQFISIEIGVQLAKNEFFKQTGNDRKN